MHGWAIASGSVDLAEEREGLLTVDDDINGDGRWQQHQLALPLSDDGRHYDPDFLARAAEVILVSNAAVNWPNLSDQYGSYPYDQTYPPLAIGSSLWDDPELAFNQLIVVRALADNAQASFAYAELGGPDGREERLEALVSPTAWGIIEDPVHSGGDTLGWDEGHELAERFEQCAAEAVQGITIDAVADDPSLYDRSLDVYADVVRVVGDGDVPDVTKRVVASAFGLYVDDIGESALVQTESRLDTEAAAAHDFNRPDLVNFFEEIGYDEEAAARLGESKSLWVTQESLPILGATDHDQAAESAFVEPALILGAMEDGFTATGDAMAEANAGFISGLQSGATVLRVVGVAAIPATGGASLVLTGVSSAATPFINHGISEVVGDPDAPPISSGQLETAVTEELRETLATLYAAENGLPAPSAGEFRHLLIDELGGDPVRYLDIDASDEANDHGADEHWSSRLR